MVKINTKYDSVGATVKKMPFPFSNREFVVRQLVGRNEKGDYVLVALSVDQQVNYGQKVGRTIRGKTEAVVRFRSAPNNHCEVTFVQYFDPRGNIPSKMINAKVGLANTRKRKCACLRRRARQSTPSLCSHS